MRFDGLWRKDASDTPAAGDAAPARPGLVQRLRRLPPPVRLLLAMLALLIIWYGAIGGVMTGIAPDPAMRPTPSQLPPGGSVTVGLAARLVDHEIHDRSFTPNDPLFFPTGLARRTPAYQANILAVTGKLVAAIAEAKEAPRLREAAVALATPADQWWLRFGWPPVARSAEWHYRRAIAELEAHNGAIARADGPPAARPRLKPETVAGLAVLSDVAAAEALAGEQLLRGASDASVATRLAAARGAAYASALLMRGLRDDDLAAIRLSGRAARWGEALDALDAAAAVDPLFASRRDLVTLGYSLLIAENATRAILEGVR